MLEEFAEGVHEAQAASARPEKRSGSQMEAR
jgi:hypothetical protein